MASQSTRRIEVRHGRRKAVFRRIADQHAFRARQAAAA